MKICNLCEENNSKLYKPEQKFLGTQLSSVIQFLFGGVHVEFPPSFHICPTCAAALIQTELVLQRLSKALPNNKFFNNDCLNNVQVDTEKAENNEGVTTDVFALITSPFMWTFYCTHCEYKTDVAKVYKRHLLSRHRDGNQRIYQCMFCKETYERINGIKNHISCVHGNAPRLKRKTRKSIAQDNPSLLGSTTVKGQEKNDTSVLNTSYESNAPNGTTMPHKFECTHCIYTTVYPKMFKRHLNSKHEVEESRIYKCKQCPSRFMRLFALTNHIAYDHEHKPRPKSIRQKSLTPNFALSIAGDKELQVKAERVEESEPQTEERFDNHDGEIDNINENVAQTPQAEEETQNHGSKIVNHKTDNMNQSGNVSQETQPTKDTGDYGYEVVNGEIAKENINSDTQENENHMFQTPQKKKSNNLSFSEISTSKWIFQCLDCEFETEKKKKFRSHLSYQHGLLDRDIYKCLYCSASYERYSLLHIHMMNKHTVDIEAISDTSAIYSDSSLDNMHAHSAKKRKVEDKPVMAKESNPEESSLQEQTNMLNASEKNSCGVCNKKFSTKPKLRAHMDKHHTADETSLETMLNCQFPACPKRFSKRSKMQQHMREKHPDLKN